MTDVPDEFFVADETWLEVLPTYQRTLIEQLLASGKTMEEVRDLWLSSKGATDTAGFGGETLGLFKDRFLEEMRALICGPRYAKERKEYGQLLPNRTAVVAAVSALIGSQIGASSVLIAPAVVLTCITVAKVGVRSWCAVTAPKDPPKAS